MEILIVLAVVIAVAMLLNSAPSKPKSYPILQAEQLQPQGQPLSTLTDAKKAYRAWMSGIKFLDKDELTDHVNFFSDEIKSQDEALRSDLSEAKKELKAAEGRKARLVKAIEAAKDEEKRDDLEYELEEVEFEIQFASQEVDRAQKEVDQFRSDKRKFIVDYINDQVHGHGWRDHAKP